MLIIFVRLIAHHTRANACEFSLRRVLANLLRRLNAERLTAVRRVPRISILKSRVPPRRRKIICIQRDDSQASRRSSEAVRAPAFNPGAFVTRVTHFTAPHAPAIPSRNVQDPTRLPPLFPPRSLSLSLSVALLFSAPPPHHRLHLDPSTPLSLTLAYSRG